MPDRREVSRIEGFSDAVFTLFYWNVYRRRGEMALTSLQVFGARAGMQTHAISVAVGVLSIVLAVIYREGTRENNSLIDASAPSSSGRPRPKQKRR